MSAGPRRGTVRALAAASVAVVTALALPSAATADTPSELTGGCRWRGVADRGGHSGEPATYLVVLEAQVAVYSRAAAANPVGATVTCTLRVGGELRATASFAGTTVVAGLRTFEVALRRDEWFEICTSVDFTTDDTDSVAWCEGPPDGPPPHEIVSAAGELLRQVPGGELRCVVTSAAAPFAPDVYLVPAIMPNGDVYVGDDRLVHCPPG